MRQQFHLRIREQLHSGAGKPVPPLSAASAPASFKRPTFGVKPAEPETLLDDIDHRGGSLGNAIRMITGQLGNKSAELANLFAAGSRNSIGGGANRFNADQAFVVGSWGMSQALGLSDSQAAVAGRGAGHTRFWQAMQELRTLGVQGLAFGVMFGTEQQRDRSIAAFAADLVETGLVRKVEPIEGAPALLRRYHFGFFSVPNVDLSPRNYGAFVDVVAGISDRVRQSRADLAADVGAAIAGLPDALFSGKAGVLEARDNMIRRLIEVGERLRLGTAAV